MKLSTVLGRVALVIVLTAPLTMAQNANDYRSVTTGTWGSTATWERYSGSAWEAALSAPDSGAGLITIQAGHTVTIASSVVVDSVQVLGLGHIIVNAGTTVTVALNAGRQGIDVDTTGTVEVNGTVVNLGSITGAVQGYIFNDGSVYNHAQNAGSVPRSLWNAGSTFRLTGVTAGNPSNTNQDFHHIIIDNAGQTANLNLGMSGNTIHGNVTVLQTGASNRYYLTSPTAYVNPITIQGDLYVMGGQFSTNGSNSAANIVANVYGDVFTTAGNFGSSRGSGTSAAWFFYGDTVSFTNTTLQNSGSSPALLQRFVFAKQGTQILRMSGITYGAAGTSPITWQVSAGTTLDIGTSHITNNCTGSFILDSGATLVTAHNGVGNEGNIEPLADYGGGNSFVNVLATAGTGSVSVTATKGVHPNAYAPAKTLQRYWTIAANAGITQATLTFNYFDVPTAAVSDVMGTEADYKALRYFGSGNGWYTIAGSTVDDLFDFVTATGQTTVSGVWTVGETTPDPTAVTPSDGSDIPTVFTVGQNYPNPFNPTTTITFGLPKESRVAVKVFDMLGREVATLFEGMQNAGTHTLTFNGDGLASGFYMYKVSTETEQFVRKMLLTK